jgi:glyoxylase-like metal-dependent hydrolase (beta-lactamase superfamily II)/rhodanese-related sulfurtransferase
VLFRQFVDPDLGCASYLVGDIEAGAAVVVDPAYAIDPYVEAAGAEGVRIAWVLETHTHADHVSGHGRFALEHGVRVAIHPLARAGYHHAAIDDGDELYLGSVRIRVLHTPGHRPEHCAFLVGDEVVLTGDSLFVGDAARPDLAVGAREGAEGLFHSLRRLADLPDRVAVFPGHLAGSLCGAAMSSDPCSTIGAEKRSNHALRIPELAAFVAESASISTPRPPNIERIVDLNRGPFLGAPEPLRPIRYEPGLTVLDVRPADEHLAGHVHGALNVPIDGGSFATKAGFVLGPDDRVAIEASSPGAAERAARGLRSVGFIELEGCLVDAPDVEQVAPVTLDELEELLASGAADVIDVREPDEHETYAIPGTRQASYRELRAGGAELARGRPVVTVCESGARAAVAASILQAAGVDARPVIDGGIADWDSRRVGSR